MASCICGHSTYRSQCKSLRPPFFLCTNTTALHHRLWHGQIAPAIYISFMCAWTSPTICGEILQNLSLKGSSSTTLILCFARSLQPNSPSSKEKMSWHSASRTWAVVWFLSDYLSWPDNSSCWKSISFLHSTDILDCWIPWISSSFSNVPSATSTWSTAFVATTWATLMPLAMVIRAAVSFFTMTTTHLFPVVISVWVFMTHKQWSKQGPWPPSRICIITCMLLPKIWSLFGCVWSWMKM